MGIADEFRFAVWGSSPKRLGYCLAFVSVGCVPAHFYVSCETSGMIGGGAMVLLVAVSVLSFVVPRGTPGRFGPLAVAVVALLAHSLCAH